MTHYLNDNTYYIADDSGKPIFTIILEGENQVTIKTPTEVYSGPIDLIWFKENKED